MFSILEGKKNDSMQIDGGINGNKCSKPYLTRRAG